MRAPFRQDAPAPRHRDYFVQASCTAVINRPRTEGPSMKRYPIFAAVGPLLGGFWLLLTTTLMSGYWSKPPNAAEVTKLLTVFATTLQYSYLFGILPALMIGAVDDILSHVKRIGPLLRMLLVGVIA